MQPVLEVNVNPECRAVRLYGRLGTKFGRVHYLSVHNASEAVRALGCLFPEFDAYLTQSKDRGEGYGVFYGKRNLDKTELRDPSGGEDIRIAPFMLGNKNGGWVNIIVGIVLIVVGVFLFETGPVATALISAGIGMIAGGVVQLLTPIPKGTSAKDRPDQAASYSFNGPINTQAQGNPVQVLYGKLHVGSAVLSAGINAVDQAIVPTGVNGAGYGGGGGGGYPAYQAE